MMDLGAALILSMLALAGVWAIVYPRGVIGLARHAHPQLAEDDPAIAFCARLIGAVLVAMVIVIFLASLFGRSK
jgi:hypothetical protein